MCTTMNVLIITVNNSALKIELNLKWIISILSHKYNETEETKKMTCFYFLHSHLLINVIQKYFLQQNTSSLFQILSAYGLLFKRPFETRVLFLHVNTYCSMQTVEILFRHFVHKKNVSKTTIESRIDWFSLSFIRIRKLQCWLN